MRPRALALIFGRGSRGQNGKDFLWCRGPAWMAGANTLFFDVGSKRAKRLQLTDQLQIVVMRARLGGGHGIRMNQLAGAV